MPVSPEISVCIFSYNFGRYLEQAIDSVIAQKLSVPFEIVIGDDRSTDESPTIISRYQALHPDLIRAVINNENIGGTRNWLQTIGACQGRYIAFLDGDDYFTDDLKLQKQYDVMEANGEVVLCFHGVKEIYEDGKMGNDNIVRFTKSRYTVGDILEKGWFIRTGSMFFRNGILPGKMPEWIYDYPYRLDSILPVFLCMNGDALYVDEVWSAWRKHDRGMSYRLLEDQIKDAITRIGLAKDLDKYSESRYIKHTQLRISSLYTSLFFSILRSGGLFRHSGLFVRTLANMDHLKALRVVKRSLLGVKET